MELPNKLRLIDGELVLADGGDVREYLREFAKKAGVDENTPVALSSHDSLRNWEREVHARAIYSSAA